MGTLEEKVRPPEQGFPPRLVGLLRRIVLGLLEEAATEGPLDDQAVEQTWQEYERGWGVPLREDQLTHGPRWRVAGTKEERG